MRRREFITLVGGAAAWPITARAQQSAIPVVGFLSSRSPGDSSGVVAAFYQGLREAGFIEGKNVQIAFRWAEGRYDRLPALAADLVGIRVTALFVAGGPPSALAAKAATSTIPIVFSAVNDPVELGLVASLNRPGGNVTGMSTFAAEIWAKSVELLKELVPTATVIAYLVNPSSPSAGYLKGAAMAASTLGIDVRVLNAGTEQELDAVFATLPNLRVGGLAVPNEPFLDTQRVKIVALSARYAVPAVYCLREYVEDGGLMSYGFNLADSYRRAGIYLGRVLKGEKPTDLPVQQPETFELVINLKTARVLGLTVPYSLLSRANELID
jgi:putative ABC transport system substrate-binding protein